MERARLSDAELLRLVREGGEESLSALHKLELRHFAAVRAFASACVVNPSSADELAGEAWAQALRLRDGSVTGAVRPHALSLVLHTAAGWTETAQRAALNPDLVAWLETEADLSANSTAARAFGSLPDQSQTVLWHQTVEHDDSDRTRRLLGAQAEEVSRLNRRARRELYTSYVQIHQDRTGDDRCRPFHRMVLAYAEDKSLDAVADLAPHLEGCAHCSQAVADLGLMRADCGALLAEAVLPWGGSAYADAGLAASATGVHALSPYGPGPGPEPGAGAGSEAPTEELVFGPRLPRTAGTGRPGPGRTAGGRKRGDRLVRGAALLGLCSLVVALAYAGSLGPGSPQGNQSAPPQNPSRPPTRPPTTATATATSTVTATRTPPPPPRRTTPSSPPVRDAAVEWLFDKVNGGVTPDSSGNARNGTLVGSPPPVAVSGGALEFDGLQSVASNHSVVDTNHSFSVSARVKLRDKDGYQTVVSQDGSCISGFSLQYDSDADRWAMAIHDDDDIDSEKDQAVSESEPRTGKWTYLAGVYDDHDDEIRLYVDGKLEDTSGHDSDWGADGDFAAGRALADQQYIQGFQGTIDDVRAFDRTLSDHEAAALAHGS